MKERLVHLVVPAHADLGVLARGVETFELGAGLEASWIEGLPDGVLALEVTPIGYETHFSTSPEPERVDLQAEERRAEKRRRQGWSEAKIQRALEDRRRRVERDNETRGWVRSQFINEHPHEWQPFVEDALRSGAADWIGIVVGDVTPNGDPAAVTRQVTSSVAELDQLGGLYSIEDDVLFVITR